MKAIALAAVLAAATPVEAAACHHYSYWAYRAPQRCALTRSPLRVGHEAPFVAPPARDIPLPRLTDADFGGGEADDLARSRLLLRAVLEAPDAHQGARTIAGGLFAGH